MSRYLIVTLLVCLALPMMADANTDPRMRVDEAVALYSSGLDTADRDLRLETFRSSERLFAAAIETGGATADLYANLGNAALQSEHLGNAVLAYRRALLLDPDHARALKNLEHVRGLAPDWVPRRSADGLLVDTFFFWHRTLSAHERSLAAAFAFAIAALLIACGIALRSGVARNLAILPGVIWAVLIVSLVLDPSETTSDDAVVTAQETIARSADSIHAPARFSRPLPTGTEVRILERREGWLRIEIANGREAWVRASSITPVAPAMRGAS
jgi:hypothetical protein